MKLRVTTFSASILVLIGLFGLVLAFVPGIPILEGIRPFLAIVGIVVLAGAAAVFVLTRRGSSAE